MGAPDSFVCQRAMRWSLRSTDPMMSHLIPLHLHATSDTCTDTAVGAGAWNLSHPPKKTTETREMGPHCQLPHPRDKRAQPSPGLSHE